MAERLEMNAYLYELLADIDARRVLTNEHDCAVYLEAPGEPPAECSKAVWLMEQAGLVREPTDSVVWELTDAGRAARDAFVAPPADAGEGRPT